MTVRLLTIATLLPDTVIAQEDVAELFARQPAMTRLGSRLVRSAFAGSGVATRRTVLPELGAATHPEARGGTAPPAQPAPQEQQPKKDVKAEIMSLFSTAAPAQPNPMAYAQQQQQAAAFGGAGAGFFSSVQPQMQAQGQFGGLGGFGAQQNVWGASPAVQQQQPQQQTSMMGNAGVGMWGASSGWNAAPAAPAQPDIWGTPSMGVGTGAGAGAQQSLFSTSDVWSTPATTATTASAFGGAPAQKKDDAFGDLWGGFK